MSKLAQIYKDVSEVAIPGDTLFAPSKDLVATQKKRVNYQLWYDLKKGQFLDHSGLKSPKAFHLNMGK